MLEPLTFLFEKYNELYVTFKVDKNDEQASRKQLGRLAKEIQTEFVETAFKIAKKNNISEEDFFDILADKIIVNNSQNRHFWLVIKFLSNDIKGVYHNRSFEKMLWKLLKSERFTWLMDYYVETLVDYWHYNDFHNDDDKVSFDILEAVILKEHTDTYSYGALIKAVSYISDYPEADYERVLAKARKTKMYQEDETYREWID